jgi:hypothetical protein
VSDSSSDSSPPPPTKPARSADLPPDSASTCRKGTPYFDGASLELAQQQAILRWRLPRHPEYGKLARRTRSFYREVALWDPEGKPSVGSLAAAGFYYDGRFTII